MDRARTPRRPRGFTLIELLVAIAILGILGTIVIQNVWSNIDDARQEGSKTKADLLHGIVETYRRKHNELPKSLDDLLLEDLMNNNRPYVDNPEDLLDAWNRKFELRPGERSGEFEVVSLGQNGLADR